MKLYIWEFCPFCIKVVNYINKYKLPVEIVNIENNIEKKEEIIKKLGFFQVPILKINETELMPESMDIIRFLKNKFS